MNKAEQVITCQRLAQYAHEAMVNALARKDTQAAVEWQQMARADHDMMWLRLEAIL